MARYLRTLFASSNLRLTAVIGAGVTMTFFAAWLVWIIWRGGWRGHEQQQLFYLGTGLFICLGIIVAVVAALTSTKIAARGPGGISLDVGGDDPPASP